MNMNSCMVQVLISTDTYRATGILYEHSTYNLASMRVSPFVDWEKAAKT